MFDNLGDAKQKEEVSLTDIVKRFKFDVHEKRISPKKLAFKLAMAVLLAVVLTSGGVFAMIGFGWIKFDEAYKLLDLIVLRVFLPLLTLVIGFALGKQE